MKKKLHPYVRIVLASKTGKGVVLTPDEVWNMSHDDAIETAAINIMFYEMTGEYPDEMLDHDYAECERVMNLIAERIYRCSATG